MEVAVAKVDPGGRRPRLVLESLVNPLRSMAATEIHGVTQEAVAEAPHFRDLAGDLLDALSGCCVASYNANLDIGMLRWEFRQCGVESFAPP